MAVDQNINILFMLHCLPSTKHPIHEAVAHFINTVHQFNTSDAYSAIMNNIRKT